MTLLTHEVVSSQRLERTVEMEEVELAWLKAFVALRILDVHVARLESVLRVWRKVVQPAEISLVGM